MTRERAERAAPPIPYGRQTITDEDVAAVVATLRSDFLTQGPRVQEFEEAFAAYVGAPHAVAVANGTAALHLAALALGVNERSRVITTPITFAASANCVRFCGGEVEFEDIDPATLLLDIGALSRRLEAAPPGHYQGVVAVDFAGWPARLDELRALADRHGLWIIEDACHAPGGHFTDGAGQAQRCGNGRFAELTVFSFHPVKHIACGEGGMITTSSPELHRRLQLLRTHGITRDPEVMVDNHGGWYYEMQQLGFNYRLTDIQSALGLSQLRRAEDGLARRRQIARRYDEAFSGPGSRVRVFIPPRDVGHAYHLYVVEVERRKEVYDRLRAQGIFCQVHYIPLHTMPYYRGMAARPVSLPHAEAYYSRCLSLPMYAGLTDDQQAFVIQAVREATAVG